MSPQDDNHIVHRVSLKRTRQACGPCRRKKARCPGEQPTCSLCQRLGQQCSYGLQSASTKRGRQTQAFSSNNRDSSAENGQSSPASARRFQSIEKRLDEISQLLRDRLPPTNNVTDTLDEYLPACDTGIPPNDDTLSVDDQAPTKLQELMSRSPLSPSFIQSEVQTYLKYFHDQPYCIFPKAWLLENANGLPPEIVFPLVALTRRLSVDTPGMPGRNISTGKFCADRAWNIISSKYRDGKTDLSFLQGSFLVAQLDFADGNAQRGCSSVAIGLRVIQSSQLNQGQNMDSIHGHEAEARRVVTWAFFMLDRAYNGSRNYSVCLSDNHFTLGFPSVPGQTCDSSSRGSLHERSTKQGHKVDQGILACLIRLFSLWGKATEWVFEPLVTNPLPPWQSGSAIAILESEWMQFETQFADTHRYMNVDFKRRAREDPDSRPYLSTWLCVQFLFHAIQCLIHHPFVMMIKLRQGSEYLSATFLQKSFESSLLHSRWIARFVKEMQEVDIKLYDPFFGYLAAIAATIQLEHTGNKNPQIALLVNNEYRILVGFISELSSQWESMEILVARVNELAARRQNHGSLFYNQDGFSGALSVMPTPANLPRMSTEDEALMWDILDITSSSSSLESTRVTKLGSSNPTKTNQPRRRTSGLSSEAAEPQAATDTVMDSETSRLADEVSDWPFEYEANSHAFASGIPDIPDWMIFGDFLTQHL